MRAGDLRHVVTIQRRVTGSPQKTPSGQPDESWQDYLTGVSAAIEPLRGKEYFEAMATQGELAVRIRIRYRTGIEHGMRVVEGSTVYPIEAPPIDVGGRGIELHLMCSQGASNG